MTKQATDTFEKTARRNAPRALAVAVSLGAHLAIVPVLIFAADTDPEPAAYDPPVIVSLVEPPKPPPPPDPAPAETPEPSPTPAAAPSPAPPSPAAPRLKPTPPPRAPPARVTPPATVPSIPAAPPSTGEAFVTVGEGQLAGATRAGSGAGSGGGSGSGAGGGSCDMVGRLQAALRDDPDIRAAVGRAHDQIGPGRALLLWNGSWVRSPGQAGNGLAGVRQAIAVEIAFAPDACRSRPMRGLVVIDFADGAQLALGSGSWRWSDLLGGR